MKLQYLLWSLLIVAFIGCKEDPSAAHVSITGEISNPTSDNVKIYQGEFSKETTLEDGTFTMAFEIDQAGYFHFMHGPEYSTMYLTPGDALLMTLDTEEFDESISYEGKGAVVNNYLAAKYLKNEKLTENMSFKELFSMEEADFIREVNNLHSEQKSFFDEYINNHNLPEEFRKLEEADFSFDFGDKLLSYAEAHAYFTGEGYQENSPAIYQEISFLDIDNEAFLGLKSYNNFLNSYIQSKVDPDDEENMHYNMLETVNKEIENEKVKNLAATNIMEKALQFGVDKRTDDLMKQYKEMVTDKDMLVKVDGTYEKWSKIATGQAAPNFAYPNINGQEIALEDMKGQAVYVDIWATWCGPCLKELPHFEELQEEYSDNEKIVFTSISIDENKDAWRKMVKEKEMKGIQLIADKAWNSKINEDYIINGIPRYILIDAGGNIVDANAPRPSSEEIRDLLEKAINGKKS